MISVFILLAFQQFNWNILYKLLPPFTVHLFRCPLLDLKLTQPASKIHYSYSNYLWLPLQGQHGAQAETHHRKH